MCGNVLGGLGVFIYVWNVFGMLGMFEIYLRTGMRLGIFAYIFEMVGCF